MTMRVVAVVVSKDQPLYLQNALDALSKQSFRLERVLVVDSSTMEETKPVLDNFVSQSSKHAVLSILDKASFAELSALAIKQVLEGFENLDDVAIWLLHDDTVPEIHALAELVRALEVSPLVAVASPKQVAIENPKLIVQQGLTLTKSLKPFSLVNDELDQKQHDYMSDVLAVSSNAMLIRANSWIELGGYSLTAPELATDIDLGIRTHQLGSRVVVVPTARVRHAELSLQGKREKSWLGGSVKFALAKATNHLRLSHAPIFLAFLYWLGLPVISIAQVVWLLLVKRPDRILFTLRANLWAFLTVRARLRDRHSISLKPLRVLFANSAQVRSRSRLALETAEQKSNLENFDETTPTRGSITQVGFIASGGLWIMLGLTALSYKFFPLGQAAIGGFALPLSDSWLQLFAHAGASFQHIGLGLAAASDPFNWVLLAIGSITFWSPNLALSVLLLIAKPLAFMGAWRLLSTVTVRNSIKIPLALAYTLWPALTLSQSQGNYPAVVFAITLPWLLFSLARAGRLGLSSSVRSDQQNVSWIAAAGLLVAVSLASAPSALLPLLVVGLVFAYLGRTRIRALVFIALPAVVITLPYYFDQIFTNKKPLGIFADPTVSFPTEPLAVMEAVLSSDKFFGWFSLGLVVLGVIAVASRVRAVFGIWFLALLVLANLWFINSIAFPAGGVSSIFLEPTEQVFDSSTPSVMLFVVLVISAIALWLESLTRAGVRKILVSAIFLAAATPLAVVSAMTTSQVNFVDSRNLPAIFSAEAAAGSNLRLLVLSSNGDQSFTAEEISPQGIKLDGISTAYRLNEKNLEPEADIKASITELVANMVSANGKSISQKLQARQYGYVLVPNRPGNGDLGVALNSVAELDQVGTTEFGQLWRVKKPFISNRYIEQSLLSITKSVQLAVLLGFVLLALPTARGRKNRTRSVDSFEPEGEHES